MSADPVNVFSVRLADDDIERIAERMVVLLAAAHPPPAAHPPDREWFNTKQAAAYIGLQPNTLEVLRTKGDGPKYTKPSRNIVRYKRTDLDAYLVKNGRRNTSENPPEQQRTYHKRKTKRGT